MGATHSHRPSRASASVPPVVGVPVATDAVATDAAAAAPSSAEASSDRKQQKLDLVFAMDCTGSMGSYIAAAKQNIERIAQKLTSQENADLRFGLVAYRDHPPQDQTFVVKTFSFTTALAEMQASLRTLSAQGGGDGPEAVEAGLKAALEMDWRDDATKIVVFIADAPPHGLGESGDGFPNGAPTGVDPLRVLEEMSMKGITVYSVGCQPALSHYRFATDFFIAAAERTNGQAVALGSAASLADVIMGGAVEEMDLQKLSDEVERETQQLQVSNPGWCEEELQAAVYRGMQAKGTKARQMKTAKLSSALSSVVSKAESLAEARSSLAAAAPPAPKTARMAPKGAMLHSLGAAPPPAPPGAPAPSGGGGGGGALRRRSCAKKKPLSDGVRAEEEKDDEMEEMALCCDLEEEPTYGGLAAAVGGPEVAVEEGELTVEQFSRVWGRGKKMGRY